MLLQIFGLSSPSEAIPVRRRRQQQRRWQRQQRRQQRQQRRRRRGQKRRWRRKGGGRWKGKRRGWRGTRQHTHQRAATERRRQQRACFTRLSGAGYRHCTGQTGRRLWQQARLEEQPALKRCQAGIPSARVASAADHELRIRYLYSGGGVDAAAAAGSAPAPVQQYGLWHLLRFYRQWGQRRWRLTVHVRTQKVGVEGRGPADASTPTALR